MSALSRVDYGGYPCFSRLLHLLDFLTPTRVAVSLGVRSKDDLLAQLVELAAPDAVVGAASVRDALCNEVRAREAAFPTALGDGVALPHVRTANVTSVQMAAAVLATPMPYGARDGAPVDVFFLLLSPSDAPSEHLKVLRALSRLLADPSTIDALRRATSVEAFLASVRATPAF